MEDPGEIELTREIGINLDSVSTTTFVGPGSFNIAFQRFILLLLLYLLYFDLS